MPVPKGRRSKSRRDKRSAGKRTVEKTVCACQTCQSPVAPHQICYECGRYKGVKVLRTKVDRMHERGQARREREAKGQEAEVAPVEEPAEKE